MLIIPLIKIESGISKMRIKSEQNICKITSDDPVQIATIFRGENFKAIHVSILDEFEKSEKSLDAVKNIINSVDIPVQISGSFNTPEQVENIIKMGVLRVVVNYQKFEDQNFIRTLIKEFSANKIIVRMNTIAENAYDCRWDKILALGPDSLGLILKELGVKRILLSNFFDFQMKFSFDIGRIQKFAELVRLKITLIGGIKGIRDLQAANRLINYGLDSVIIGRAIYENKFNCEALWRNNEQFLDDLGPTRRI